MLLERDELAALERPEALVNEGLRPRQIVIFEFAVGNALVDELPRRFLDGCKIAGRDTLLQPSFLFGFECYRHGSSYHKSPCSPREIEARRSSSRRLGNGPGRRRADHGQNAWNAPTTD